MIKFFAYLFVPVFFVIGAANAHSPPEETRLFFVGLEDGDVVTSPLHIKMNIEGFGIVPTGTKGRERHKGGHFHVLLNIETLPDTEYGWVIPHDDRHIHLDGGETEALLDLPAGEHTLQLLFGDEDNEAFDPPLVSEIIRIFVN